MRFFSNEAKDNVDDQDERTGAVPQQRAGSPWQDAPAGDGPDGRPAESGAHRDLSDDDTTKINDVHQDAGSDVTQPIGGHRSDLDDRPDLGDDTSFRTDTSDKSDSSTTDWSGSGAKTDDNNAVDLDLDDRTNDDDRKDVIDRKDDLDRRDSLDDHTTDEAAAEAGRDTAGIDHDTVEAGRDTAGIDHDTVKADQDALDGDRDTTDVEDTTDKAATWDRAGEEDRVADEQVADEEQAEKDEAERSMGQGTVEKVEEAKADDVVVTEPEPVVAVAAVPAVAPVTSEISGSKSFFPEAETQPLRDRWRDVQLHFVDDPKASTAEAAALVDETIEKLTTALREHRGSLSGGGDDTETLRVELRAYRDILDRLLGL
ncbi:hypothetical protein [Actinoplanes palleronii]|uniref:Uncharacterized protein n=1 Tax=Actinoplanes palleronii TaxID=113570 RepID=A0ABQ4B6T1_9ACTN|nr:hypothetical protein [Actinoplanes palleronii]GIE66394.1 hypothetical protein Apa02nite_025020 [Actinoplanes palleronii]